MSGFSCSPFFPPCVFSLAHSSPHKFSCIVCITACLLGVWRGKGKIPIQLRCREPESPFHEWGRSGDWSLLENASSHSPSVLSRQQTETAPSDVKFAPGTMTLFSCLWVRGLYKNMQQLHGHTRVWIQATKCTGPQISFQSSCCRWSFTLFLSSSLPSHPAFFAGASNKV